MEYKYGADGERAVKYASNVGRSTLYFNKMWQLSNSLKMGDWVQGQHIFVVEARVATKFSMPGENTVAEQRNTYYYHSDHLGSAQTVTDWQGMLYERVEYAPYGDTWIDWKTTSAVHTTPFRFTGKEMDSETGLYYYGARYLDPRASSWLSTDPAMWQGDFIPSAQSMTRRERETRAYQDRAVCSM